MKLKKAAAFLLFAVFLCLGVPSGAVPVWAEAAPASEETAQELPTPAEILAQEEPGPAEASPPAAEVTPSPTPPPTATPVPTEPPPTATPVPTEPPPTATPAPTEPPPTAEPSAVTVLSTTITSESPLDNDTAYAIDVEAFLAQPPALALPAEGYQILIIHTHGTEAYTPAGTDVYEASEAYRTTDTRQSVVRVGEALAEALRAYGLNVLHDEGLYDYPSYTSSYVRSGQAIEEYLAAYPGIVLVIDLHRDALGDGDTIYKTVAQTEEAPAAQIMFVMGSDENLEHPCWQENLSLALMLQNAAAQRYPYLMRPTNLCAYRYNQQLTAGSLLMEVGATGNTLQEAITAVQLFADAVGPILAAAVAPA